MVVVMVVVVVVPSSGLKSPSGLILRLITSSTSSGQSVASLHKSRRRKSASQLGANQQEKHTEGSHSSDNRQRKPAPKSTRKFHLEMKQKLEAASHDLKALMAVITQHAEEMDIDNTVMALNR